MGGDRKPDLRTGHRVFQLRFRSSCRLRFQPRDSQKDQWQD